MTQTTSRNDAVTHIESRTRTDRSEQLNTTGSALDTLRRAAIALIPARHLGGDAAWVEVTETLRYHGPTTAAELAALTPEKLARMATESLDEAAAEFEAEKAQDS